MRDAVRFARLLARDAVLRQRAERDVVFTVRQFLDLVDHAGAANHQPLTTNRETSMRKVAMTLLTFALGAAFAVFFLNGRDTVEGQAQPAAAAGGFSAVANAVGTQDATGAYEVVKGWPKDISTLPGNAKWTYGAGESVFAETPNRIYGLYRGELPNIQPP